MKIKNLFAISVIVVLGVFIGLIFYSKIGSNKNNPEFLNRCLQYCPTIKSAIGLYTPERIKNLRPDEYLFIKEAANKIGTNNIDFSILEKKYAKNIFARILSKDDYIKGIQIEKKKDALNAIGQPLEGKFYDIKNVDEKSNAETFGVWNDIIAKALYCDKTGFDNGDFYILKLLRSRDGGYLDTHFLFGLLFLKKNGCYVDENSINKEIADVSSDIAKAEDSDKIFSDLYAERIVFLYWAGQGDLVKKKWIDFVKNNFNNDYGWTEKGSQNFSGHVSGLSLLSLIYFTDGAKEHPFYEK
jgi:hypothetical protein